MEKVQVISVKPISQHTDEDTLRGTQQLPSKNSGQSHLKGDIQVNNEKIGRAKTLSFISRGGASFSKSVKHHESSTSSSANEATFDNGSLVKKVPGKEGSIGYGSERFRSSGSGRSGFSFPATSTNCFGRSDYRASYNERIRSGPSSLQQFTLNSKERRSERLAEGDFVYLKPPQLSGRGLHRSNSSLELDHEGIDEPTPDPQLRRREYGSHGSINVTSHQQESLYSLLHSYQQSKESNQSSESISPKAKNKIKLWDKDKSSIFKKLRPNKAAPEAKGDKGDASSEISVSLSGVVISNTNAKNPDTMETEVKSEENPTPKHIRRSAFIHYDCHSLAAQMTANRLHSLLADRSNTITGASAAAMADPASPQHAVHSSCEEISSDDTDHGDGRSNHLVSSCPFFHNEIGGDGERIVSLSREITRLNKAGCNHTKAAQLHRSVCASSIGLLEYSAGSHWCQNLCPYVNTPPTIEAVDQGSAFYTTFFQGHDHQNWVGIDDTLGPVAISIKREKVEEDAFDKNHSLPCYQYRIIVRTSELFTTQGTIREESLNQRGDKAKGLGAREAIEYVCPQLSVSCLRLANTSKKTEEILLKLDEMGIQNKFKVGVLYCRSGQRTEEEMYNNENAGPAFSEFLEILGQRVRLKNFEKYRGGLDKKTDSTGHYSVYALHKGCEIMFHVSTLLPFTSTNRKQLLRKRHIGNDIVTIIFQEPGSLPFSPKNIRSHFMHVFIIVQAVNPCTDNTMYSISVSRFQDVPMFGPPIPEGATFPKSKKFTDFLLAKIINGQIAALRSDKFVALATRTRNEYLKELAMMHATSTSLESTSKFSLMGFSRASKKEKNRFKFVSDCTVKGALSWAVCVHDATLQQNVDCVLAISVDSVVVLEESSSSIIFAAACKSILGWMTKPGQGILLFYHQGECLIINFRPDTSESEGEEINSEIVSRLSAVSQGAKCQELILRRNTVGLLGFNVQQDGVITEVEPYGLAAQAGLQQGSRLVEICTIALSTLCQEQMVDLLKNSMTVTVTVIPPRKDGTPRRGCNVPTCSFLLGCSEGDYENLTPPEKPPTSHSKHRIKQLSRCDRSLSPPRSGSSSGYGTGSSSHSFSLEGIHGGKIPSLQEPNLEEELAAKDKFSHQLPSDGARYNEYTNTLSSTSSGHSNDRWSEVTPNDLTQGGVSKSAPSVESHSSIQHVTPASPCIAPAYQHQRHSPHAQGGRESSPPPPLPARAFQTSRETGYVSSLPHTRNNPSNPNPGHSTVNINREYSTDVKYSLFARSNSPLLTSYQSNLEQGNYAVPAPFPRPVHRDFFDNRTKKADNAGGYCDYDNAPSAIDYLGSNLKQQSFRRNSSPQPLETKDSEGNEVIHAKSLNCLKTRHSIPKNLSEEGKALEDHLTISRSEDELSGSSSGSPHGFQRVRSSGSNSSPSLSSRTQSPHTMNPPAAAKDVPSVVRLKQSAAHTKHSVNRNSANYASSNLQDELLKLINPDYLSDSDNMVVEIAEKKGYHNQAFTEEGLAPLKDGRENKPLSASQRVNSNDANSNYSSAAFYDCPNPTYQTIGEAEFSSRKSVFTKATKSNQESSQAKQHVDGGKKEAPPRKPQASEGMLLTARPATVISNSSTASSPAPTAEQQKDKVISDPLTPVDQTSEMESAESLPQQFRHLSEVKGNNIQNAAHDSRQPVKGINVPDLEAEWNSLVHTATRAIEKTVELAPSTIANRERLPPEQHDLNANSQTTSSHPPPSPKSFAKHPQMLGNACAPAGDENYCDHVNYNLEPPTNNNDYSRASSQASYYANTRQTDCFAAGLKLPASGEDPDIKQRVQHLEQALAAEQQRSGQLEEEVSFLRSENRKLQEDSRATAHQLHQFTEWFFNTIDKG